MPAILSIIIFLPLLGGIVVLLIPKEQVQAIRWTAVGFAALGLLLALILILLYAGANVTSTSQTLGTAPNGTFLFNERVSWIPAIGINYGVGVDGISLFLVALTALLTLVCIAASFGIERKVKNYMAFMLLLDCGILGVFLSTNLFLFYIFWEVMLIPGYFLVGGWGGEHRIYAAFKFVLYTSVGSLLMLAGIIALGYYHQLAVGGSYSLDLNVLLNGTIASGAQTWIMLAFALAFAIKTPLIPFHSWVPDAYGEAPAPVTALLAGAMSKTGAYGFLRFVLPLFPAAVHEFAPLFSVLAVIGILYCAVLALVQSDLKRLLAYSSISHLGVIVLGIFAFNTQGVEGAVLQMVNHGVTMTALFLVVGFIEARTLTRNIRNLSGMAWRVPILATVLMIACLSSLGLPGLNSFAGEFLALLGAFRANEVFGILGTAVVIPAAWYLTRLVLGVMEGPIQRTGMLATLDRKGKLSDIHIGEFVVLLPLLLLIFYIGLQPAPFTSLMEPSVVNTLQTLGRAIVP